MIKNNISLININHKIIVNKLIKNKLNLYYYSKSSFMSKAIKKKWKLSIIVTCFNESKTIIMTIDTLKDCLQTLKKNYEIIVVDDHSTDDSIELISVYLEQNKKLPILLKKNKVNFGFVKTIAKGLKFAKGDYVWIVGGDNTVSRDSIEKLVTKIGKADIIIPDVKYISRSIIRQFISRSYTFFIHVLSNTKLKYYNGSSIYKKRDLLDNIVLLERFSYSAEILIKLLNNKKTYLEVPVIYTEKKFKKSSALSFKNFFQILIFFYLIKIKLFLIKNQPLLFKKKNKKYK